MRWGLWDKWAVLPKPDYLTISGHAILDYLIIRSFRRTINYHDGKLMIGSYPFLLSSILIQSCSSPNLSASLTPGGPVAWEH